MMLRRCEPRRVAAATHHAAVVGPAVRGQLAHGANQRFVQLPPQSEVEADHAGNAAHTERPFATSRGIKRAIVRPRTTTPRPDPTVMIVALSLWLLTISSGRQMRLRWHAPRIKFLRAKRIGSKSSRRSSPKAQSKPA